MRIIAGKFKGRNLAAPKSRNIRPTADRVRESMFNMLVHNQAVRMENCRVLDLFAGSGALGCEALSRGAAFCLFIEKSGEGRALLRRNIESLNLGGQVKISRRDACAPGPYGKGAPFGLVFADPPYGKGLGEKALAECARLGWMAQGAIIVLEEETAFEPSEPSALAGFELLARNRIGETGLFIYKLKSADDRSEKDNSA